MTTIHTVKEWLGERDATELDPAAWGAYADALRMEAYYFTEALCEVVYEADGIDGVQSLYEHVMGANDAAIDGCVQVWLAANQ